jgi:hypothetical protein
MSICRLHAIIPRAPYPWDEARRGQLRAELDAWFARAYGLTRDELRYILDPADVYGPDFPGETFRVLKEKETAKFGEYRTRRLVLQAWDRLERGERGDGRGETRRHGDGEMRGQIRRISHPPASAGGVG